MLSVAVRQRPLMNLYLQFILLLLPARSIDTSRQSSSSFKPRINHFGNSLARGAFAGQRRHPPRKPRLLAAQHLRRSAR